MAENVTLREAVNGVLLVGVLKSKEIEDRTFNGVTRCSAKFVIITGKDNEVQVKASQARLKKDGTNNPMYDGLHTIDKEYVSVAELMEQGMSREDAMQRATKVTTGTKDIKLGDKMTVAGRGTLELNEYYGKDNQLHSNMDIRVSTLSRLRDDTKFDPGATFKVEMYVDRIVPEMVDDEETGRVKITGLIPLYGGRVVPMSFVAADGASSYIQDNYNKGDTIWVSGKVVNTAHTTKTEVQGFMKAEVSYRTTYVRELLIENGCSEPYAEEDTKRFNPESIRAAMKVRETEYLPGLKERAQNNAGSANNVTDGGFAGNGFSAGGFAQATQAPAPSASPFSMEGLI